jgi:hypothetical protein
LSPAGAGSVYPSGKLAKIVSGKAVVKTARTLALAVLAAAAAAAAVVGELRAGAVWGSRRMDARPLRPVLVAAPAGRSW